MSETQLLLSIPFVLTPRIGSILNLVGPDMMVLLLIVLLLFGAKKLPELARGMGGAVKELRGVREDIESVVNHSVLSQKTPKLPDR